MASIRKVAVVGSGVIGSGWAARCLARGIEVVAWDPGKGAEAQMRANVANAWPAMAKLGMAPNASQDKLTFVPTLEQCVADADFIQENAPDREDLKRKLFNQIAEACRPDVLIASSSSGLLPTDIQRECKNPERTLIGHPFNPVYLLPLVELVGGKKTAPETITTAADFYRAIGMYPLHVRKEIEGYLSDRLQEALWREVLHLVNDGVATTEELDAAIAYGPGLRWSIWGTNLIFHLAGGEGGMRHMLEHFGPALELPWTKLKAPTLTPELIDRMASGTEAQAAGRSIKELERVRDDCLIAVMQALKQHKQGAGNVLIEDEARRYQSRKLSRWKQGDTVPTPFAVYEGTVEMNWLDYNGHMSESFYLWAFGDATDALFRYIGVDDDYRASGKSFYTVESHVNYHHEVGGGEPLKYTTQLLDCDSKRLHIFNWMHHGRTGELLATTEQMLLHVDMKAQRASMMPADVQQAVDAVMAAHKSLPTPDGTGHKIGIKR
ncbi:MAG: L-carnitine dehydrogenase [Dongiaceae bacterium]